MDILRLYRDYNVPHLTEGHKHCRPGYVNTQCPFCTGHYGWHLSWNIAEEYFVCWRCGWHPPILTISELLKVKINVAIDILKAYEVNRSIVKAYKVEKQTFKIPSNLSDKLLKSHKQYLRDRNFDPVKLQEIWGLKSTTPLSVLKYAKAGQLKRLNFAHRIFIPFNWNGEMVSYDSRDVTGKAENKYQACPIEIELIEHKNILFGNQEAWGLTGIGVEGPTDTFRLGEKACATSGIKFTYSQIKHISTIFKRFAIVYDDEIQAQQQAKKLKFELQARGVDAWIEKIKGDPGSLSDKDAKELVKRIMKRK